jgi:hypothetical protein
MSENKNILADLNALVKRASASKAEDLAKAEKSTKTAESVSQKLDSMSGGTSPATTGAQAASNMSIQKETYTAPAVDNAAKDSVPGASLTENTEGATAASVNGQEGDQGGMMEPKKEADNGTEKPENKIAAVKEMADGLRKAAEALLSPLDRFLVKAAKASEAAKKNPSIKTAMDMADDGAMADAAGDVLLQQLESGEISEEEAAQILQEAVQSGAITEEDLQEASASEGAPAEAPAAGGDGNGDEGVLAAGAPVAPEGEEVVEDAELEEKLAAAEIGPDHEKYLEKLATLYPDVVHAGYAFGLKLAEDLAAEAEAIPGAGAAAEAPMAPEAPMDPAAGGGAQQLSPEDAKAALLAVAQELGMTPEQAVQILASPAPEMDKVAAAKAQVRGQLLNKIATLQK